jgi:hypothetical protein
MSNSYLEETWRNKSDQEIIAAGNRLNYFYEDARTLILGELKRRGLPDPPPATGDRPETFDRRMIGVLLLLFGIVGFAVFLYAILFRRVNGSAYSGLGCSIAMCGYGLKRINTSQKAEEAEQ